MGNLFNASHSAHVSTGVASVSSLLVNNNLLVFRLCCADEHFLTVDNFVQVYLKGTFYTQVARTGIFYVKILTRFKTIINPRKDSFKDFKICPLKLNHLTFFYYFITTYVIIQWISIGFIRNLQSFSFFYIVS